MTNFLLRDPELVNLDGTDTGRDSLSHTSLGVFLACQQKWNWSREQRLEPAVTATPLAVGRAFADALEHNDPDMGERALREHAAVEAARAAGNPWLTAPDQADVDVQATIVREAARAYLAAYGAHGVTRELAMRVRVRNPAVGGRYSQTADVTGRVDVISDDLTLVFEDKLRSRIDKALLPKQLRLDRQVTINVYLCWRVHGVIPRVKYRVTKKPGIKQRQNETLDAYLQRIADDYRDRPDFYLHEEDVERTPMDLLRLEQELWAWSEQLRVARASGVFPRNPDSCDRYGGCAFLAACTREPGWETQFVERPRRSEPANEVEKRDTTQEVAAA